MCNVTDRRIALTVHGNTSSMTSPIEVFAAEAEVINDEAFCRWVVADLRKLKRDLARAKVAGGFYEIPVPAPDKVEGYSLLQYIMITKFASLWDGPIPDDAFIETSLKIPTMKVPGRRMDKFVEAIEEKIQVHRRCMNLSQGVTLEVRVIHSQGWHAVGNMDARKRQMAEAHVFDSVAVLSFGFTFAVVSRTAKKRA